MPPLWHGCFGGVFPIGHRLRRRFPGHWLRIHHLPGSKRFPASAAQWRELFGRHREVMTALFKKDVGYVWSFYADEVKALPDKAMLECFGGEPVTDLPCAADGEEDMLPSAVYQGILPDITASRDMVIGIMLYKFYQEDFPHHLSFVCADQSAVYCPYDGGGDIFLADPSEVAELKNRLGPYLSPRADGL